MRNTIARPIWIFIPLISLLPLTLYIVMVYGGHDFLFHATSWVELQHSWKAREWQFGWAQGAHHGFGEPRFCFYPPLSLIVGAVLASILPFRLVPGIVTWLIISISGLTMYYSTRKILHGNLRTAAAILYMFNPYLILTVFLRYSVAEAWVQAFLPLIVIAAYALIQLYEIRTLVVLALLLTLGWLTDIPESIVLFYTLAFLSIVVSWARRSARPAVMIALSESAALLLSGFRLLPAFAETKWISSQALLQFSLKGKMPFYGTHPSMLVVFCTAYLVAALVPAMLASRNSAHLRPDKVTLSFYLIALAIWSALIQLPVSLLLWRVLPEFRYVQFPFRFLPLLCVASLLLLLQRDVSQRIRVSAVTTAAGLALFPFLAYSHLLPFLRFPAITPALRSWSIGYEGTPEYIPASVPWTNALNATEIIRQATGPFASRACLPTSVAATANHRVVATSNPAGPCKLVLNTYSYPFWKAQIQNGLPLRIQSDHGLLAVLVPPGEHLIEFTFNPQTRLRKLSGVMSGLTLIALMGTFVLDARRRMVGDATRRAINES